MVILNEAPSLIFFGLLSGRMKKDFLITHKKMASISESLSSEWEI